MFQSKWLRQALAVVLIIGLPATAIAKDKVPKPAKTEVEKAVGKCRKSLIGGALLGGLLGAVVDGKKGAALGVGGGLLIGGVACAIMMKNAKKADALFAAQMTMATTGRPYKTTFDDDEGTTATFSGKAINVTADGAMLTPVKYPNGTGGFDVSPALSGTGQICRDSQGSISYGAQSTVVPTQRFCRQPDNSWKPYAVTT